MTGLVASLDREAGPLNSVNASHKTAPTRCFACIRRPESAAPISKALPLHAIDQKIVTILIGENVRAVREAALVLLTCHPTSMRSVLSAPGVAQALQGKLLISLLGGVSVAGIAATLNSACPQDTDPEKKYYVMRAMSNVAAAIGRAMTVISDYSTSIPPHLLERGERTLRSFGTVEYILPQHINVYTALCGSGPAFFAVILEAFANGAASLGLPRDQALRIAVQTMRGTTELALSGDDPAIIREKVTTPGGSTRRGLLALEEGCVEDTIANALRMSAGCYSAVTQIDKDIHS